MSPRRLARFLGTALLVVVLAASGLYVLVYLYRWEWNRATIAGIFFLSALVIAGTLIVLRAVRRVEARLDRLEGARQRAAGVLADANAHHAARHFEWMRRPPDRLDVFIPVLLGAGVLLSFVAFVFERLAGAIAGPVLDRRTARLVEPDLPLGDGTGIHDSRADHPRSRAVGAVLVTLLAFGGWAAVDAIGDATQSRPEVPAFAGTTVIELRIEQRGSRRPAADVAATLWTACRTVAPPEVSLEAVDEIGLDRAIVVLDRQLGDLHRLRLEGCLTDLQTDHVIAHVVRVEMHDPTRSGS